MSALCFSICYNCPLVGDTSAFVGQRMTVIVRTLCQLILCLLTTPHPWIGRELYVRDGCGVVRHLAVNSAQTGARGRLELTMRYEQSSLLKASW